MEKQEFVPQENPQGHSHEYTQEKPQGHSHDHTQIKTHSHSHDLSLEPSMNDSDLSLEHTHRHNQEKTKAIVNRLARAIGHLESVKEMVEQQEDCTKVLIQLAAVRSAINNAGKEILKEHIDSCITDALAHGDTNAIKELNDAIDKFMK